MKNFALSAMLVLVGIMTISHSNRAYAEDRVSVTAPCGAECSCNKSGGMPIYSGGSFSGCNYGSGSFQRWTPPTTFGGGGGPGVIGSPGTTVADRDANAEKDCKNGNPIIFSTGNKIEPEHDFSSSGEVPLQLTRTYNHYWQGAGLFGKHWISDFDYKLTFGTTALNACYPRPGGGSCGIGSNTVIYAWRPDGRTIKFTKNATNGIFYEDKASPIAYIERKSDGTFIHHAETGEYETYTSTGYISKITRFNVGWTFTYSGTYPQSVTHTSGRQVDFTWSGGQLVGVSDPAGNQYQYTYSANKFGAGLHRLATAKLPGAPLTTITYHYELASDTTALTGKSFNGVRYSTFTYDANGYATSSHHNGTDKYTFAYTPGTNGWLTVLQTNPLGKKTTFVFKDGKLTTTTGHPSTYCPGTSYALIEYDANGYPSMKSDFNGNETSYTYNAKGQLLQTIEALGTPQARTTNYEWWDGYRLMSATVPGLSKTAYYYDPIQRLSRIAVTNLSTNGVANQTRNTWYTYTDYGQSLPNGVQIPGMLASMTIDGPLSNDEIIVRYNSLGNLLSEENSLGHKTLYSAHNGLGQPGRVTTANGAITDYTLDARGRTTRIRMYPNGVAADTTFAYNGSGDVASVTTPDGVSTKYFYDQNRVLGTVQRNESSGTHPIAAQTWERDVAGNVTAVVKARISKKMQMPPCTIPRPACWPGGEPGDPVPVIVSDDYYKTFIDYDELSRPRAKRGNNGQNVRYTYDQNGNIKTIKDSLNKVTTLTYDALDRLVQSKDPLGKVTKFEYDLGDRITKVTAPTSRVTTFVYDGFGQLWAQNSPDTGSTTFQYNAAGQRTKMTRASGGITMYSYDGLGRLTGVTAGGQSQTFLYDSCTNGKARLCKVTDPTGSVSYTYSPQGWLTKQISAMPASGGATYTYAYDNMGRVSGIGYPGGVYVGYGYAYGKLTTVTATIGGTTTNVVSGASYQPFGPAVRWTYGNGLVRNLTYDMNERPTARNTKNGAAFLQNLSYTYNANDQITRIGNSVQSTLTQNYTYDAVGRLKTVVASGANQDFLYDANGNRTSHTWGGQADLYSVPAANNRLTAVTGPRAKSFSFDANGNLTSNAGATYTYDVFNRMASATKSGVTTTYAVNALGQRVYKKVGSTKHWFTYGAGNSMLGEYKAGQGWTQYIYFQGEPVAMVRAGTISYIHTDHLGRPELVTNGAKATVWRGSNYAFDRTVALNSIGGLNLGLPGQYYDAETGLWNNGFRDYDASIGRYVQSDPIGLMGGANTYTYVRSNPVSLIDPFGLRDCVCGAESTSVETSEKIYSSQEAINENQGNNAAMTAMSNMASIAFAAFGPMGRFANVTGAAAIASAGYSMTPITLYEGDKLVTEISHGSSSGEFAVDIWLYGADGKLKLERSLEKCAGE